MCDIALVQNEDDGGFYEVRITLNGEALYARLCDSHEAVIADADGAITDLLRAGWQLRGGDDGASVRERYFRLGCVPLADSVGRSRRYVLTSTASTSIY